MNDNTANIDTTNVVIDTKPSYIFNKSFVVNKLIRTLEYNYEFENVDGLNNWPIVVIPRSGSFVATSKSQQLDTTVIFCTNTGVCDDTNPDVLPYKLDYSCGLNNKDLLFTTLRVKVNEKGTNDYIYSSGQHVECIDCLNVPHISFSGNMSLDQNSSNYTHVVASIHDLQSGQYYEWSYNNISSNWPATISPISGSFIANEPTYEINTLVSFCQNSSCSGSPGYLNFTTDHMSYVNKYVNLGFSINSNSHCYFDNANYTLNVKCKDCLPFPHISFSTQSLSLKDHCSDLNVNISGLDNYQGYDYFFDAHASNWPITISPISGSFVTANNQSVNIPFKVAFCGSEALCSGNPNLINYNIDYNKLYTNTECEKYAYIRYNLVKSSNFSVQSLVGNTAIPDNPSIQSEFLKISCDSCLGSDIADAPIILSTIDTNSSDSIPTNTVIVNTGIANAGFSSGMN
jgi:ribosomal protein S27E